MVQVINDPNRNQSLGGSLVNGLSSALQGLVSHKVGQIQQKQSQQKTAHGLQALLPDISTKEAHNLALLDPKILEQVVKSKMQAPQEEAFAQALSGLLGNEQPVQQPQQQTAPQQQLTEEQELLQHVPQFFASEAGKKAFTPEQQKFLLEEVAKRNQQAPQVQQPQVQAPKPRLNAKNALELAKLGLQTRKDEKVLAHKEKAAAQKETQKYYDQVLLADKGAKEADDRLNKMEKLVKKGNLPNSALYGALKNIEEHVSPAAGAAAGAGIGALFGGIGALPGAAVGGALGGLISPVTSLLRSAHRQVAPDTEEFEKLSNQFISGAKAIFGSRITDQDLKAYMAQIPTLSNTDEGKLKIIEDMKIANKAERIRAKAMKQIIKEYGGSRPADLQIMVEEKISDQLNKLSKEFIEA